MNVPPSIPDPPVAGSGRADPAGAISSGAFERALSVTTAVACVTLLGYKFALTRLMNVNWDEFYFLSFVYSLARGELTLLMLGAYTHLFSWLTLLPGDEIQQIVVARCVMVTLLGVTAWLVWKLARTWLTGLPALIPPFVYLSAMPVLQHGGSFRFDSMLAPLSMASIVLLLAPGFNRQRDWMAGVLLGFAFAVTVKVVLFAPLFLVATLFRHQLCGDARGFRWKEVASALARLSVGAVATAAVLIGLHWLTITPAPADSVANFAATSVRKTLLDGPWFPRIATLKIFVGWQPLPWALIALGSAIALVRRRVVLASLSLSLVPLVFYRNAFAYYYVVMLAPACVLAGYAVQEMVVFVRSRSTNSAIAAGLLATIWIGIFYQGTAYAWRLSGNGQINQRAVVSAVHQIFPEPVNYIDRCGMISSFRKVGFFMSTWGVENYRDRNEPFMPAAIRESSPAFVLVNTVVLNPGYRIRGGLLPEDHRVIDRHYPTYWGPIRVAGARADLSHLEATRLTVPFAAEYRLFSEVPVLVDGSLRRPGDVLYVPAEGVVAQAPASIESTSGIQVTLFLAAARPPPPTQLPNVPIFDPL